MSSIEDRLVELAKRLDRFDARIKKLEDENKQLGARIEEADVWHNTTLPYTIERFARDIEEMERHMYRWNEVYYKVFPERLDQNLKFEDQLFNLIEPPKSTDDKPKS
jgi:predicted RNase H-like nuclease (RuvC/YqgF family)